jgi:hypothetical protein
MTIVATTTKQLEADLNDVSRKLAEVSAEVERLRRALAAVEAERETGELLSPSRPLDAPHPSAVMEVTAEEYDALAADLEAESEPSDALRRTMSLHPLPKE